ncbi:MAG: hypothetical protein J0I08_11255 [Rhizobiales bacterium]|nr:hypothetical protein [Hyphomicrobiales bacterium]
MGVNFAVPICAAVGNWLFGHPLAGGPIQLVAILLAMVIGGWREFIEH